jgi:hypothetical protein
VVAFPVVPVLAKPLVLPVWLRELVELVDGEEVAALLAVVDEVSLLATELLEDDGVVLMLLVDVVPVLAKPLVLPVALSELLELVDGDEVAAPDVLALVAEVSLLATELLVEGVVLELLLVAFPVLAKPLVLPVALKELLELVEGEDIAEVEALELPADVSLLATELLVDGVLVALPAVDEVPVLAKPLVLPVVEDELFAAAEPLTEPLMFVF